MPLVRRSEQAHSQLTVIRNVDRSTAVHHITSLSLSPRCSYPLSDHCCYCSSAVTLHNIRPTGAAGPCHPNGVLGACEGARCCSLRNTFARIVDMDSVQTVDTDESHISSSLHVSIDEPADDAATDGTLTSTPTSSTSTSISSPSRPHLQSGASTPSSAIETVHLDKALSWPGLISLGVGCTIGAGIFVVTGQVARDITGPALFLSYIISGAACMLAALCYAEMAAMAPSAGSAYAYARSTLGELAGWVIGWDLTLEYTVAASAVAKGWSEHANELLTLMGLPLPTALSTAPLDGSLGLTGGIIDLPAVLITVCLTVLLCRGVRESAAFNNVMVAVKVSIVIFVILAGLSRISTANYTPFLPYGFFSLSLFGYPVVGQTNANGDAVGVLSGASIVFFAYIGFDAVSTQAEECKRPQRDLPIGIIGSLLISTVLYVCVSLVLVGMVPYTQIDAGAPFSRAFADANLTWAEGIVAVGALTGITSVLLVTMLGQPRILLAMSRDGLLPQSFFGYVHPKYRTPYFSTILTGSLVAITSGLFPLAVLVELVSIGTLFAFTLVCVCVPVLRRSKPQLARPFLCPYSPYVPMLGAALCFLLMLSLPASNWWRLLVWLAVGLCIYVAYGRKRREKGYVLGRADEDEEEAKSENDSELRETADAGEEHEEDGDESDGEDEDGEEMADGEIEDERGVDADGSAELRTVKRLVDTAVVEMQTLASDRAQSRVHNNPAVQQDARAQQLASHQTVAAGEQTTEADKLIADGERSDDVAEQARHESAVPP